MPLFFFIASHMSFSLSNLAFIRRIHMDKTIQVNIFAVFVAVSNYLYFPRSVI